MASGDITHYQCQEYLPGDLLEHPDRIAVIGERGREVVMPLENNTGWISLLADKLASRMPQGGNTSYPSGPLSIILEISGTELGRVVIDNMNKLFRQEGKILLDL